MVAVLGLWGTIEDVLVYEVVGRDDGAVERLLRYGRRFAAQAQVPGYGVTHVSLANPVRATLRRIGFVEGESTPQIMVRILRPDRIFARLAADSDLLRTLSLEVRTPHRSLQINEPPEPRYTVRLETKESLLSRLFCCRLNLEAAIDMEMVRVNVAGPGLERKLLRELSQVFAFSEWVQWFTDYV
jgi:hypothetical protein